MKDVKVYGPQLLAYYSKPLSSSPPILYASGQTFMKSKSRVFVEKWKTGVSNRIFVAQVLSLFRIYYRKNQIYFLFKFYCSECTDFDKTSRKSVLICENFNSRIDSMLGL